MTAALFGKLFQGLYDLEVVESEAIGTVGVGEATIPAIKKYNELVQLDEVEFMQRTQGTFKLGIQFVDWLHAGHRYVHGFGIIGQDWEWLRCHHYWLQANSRGRARDFADFSINTAAALANKFIHARTDMAEFTDRPYRPRVPLRCFALRQISPRAWRSSTGSGAPKARSSMSSSTRTATSRRSRWRATARSKPTFSSIARASADF